MECSQCGAPATLKLSDGHSAYELCRDCTVVQVGSESAIGLIEALITPARPVNKCPHCGCEETQWRASGLLGCPLCYEVFGPEIPQHFGLKLTKA